MTMPDTVNAFDQPTTFLIILAAGIILGLTAGLIHAEGQGES